MTNGMFMVGGNATKEELLKAKAAIEMMLATIEKAEVTNRVEYKYRSKDTGCHCGGRCNHHNEYPYDEEEDIDCEEEEDTPCRNHSCANCPGHCTKEQQKKECHYSREQIIDMIYDSL